MLLSCAKLLLEQGEGGEQAQCVQDPEEQSMTQIDSGGPMFPNSSVGWHGMTVRDWFAGQALIGYLASSGPDSEKRPDFAARMAYEYADAMITRRRATREG